MCQLRGGGCASVSSHHAGGSDDEASGWCNGRDLGQAVPVTQLVVLMNKMTNSFDQLCKDNGMYSVLSNGERFLAVCGHESTNDEHTEVALRFASKLLKGEFPCDNCSR